MWLMAPLFPEGLPHTFPDQETNHESRTTNHSQKDLFLRAEATPARLYAGEPALVTYYLYSRVPATVRVVQEPSFPRFSIVQTGSLPPVVQDTVGGSIYFREALLQVLAFPSGSGRLLPGRMVLRTGSGEELAVDAPALTVRPLPAPPAGFNGAVGRFRVRARLQGRGDAQVLEVQLEGAGNFMELNAPQVTWPEGWTEYEPQVTDALEQRQGRLRGSRVYRVACTPPRSVRSLPEVRFIYFDPAAGRYVDYCVIASSE